MMIPTQLVAGASHLHKMQSVPPVINSFWQKGHVQEHLQNLRETVKLVKAIQKELEELILVRQSRANNVEGGDTTSNTILGENFLPSSNNSFPAHVFQYNANDTPLQISEVVWEKKINLNVQEFLSLEAANSLISALKSQVAPFSAITSETSSWEERSMAVRLSQKLQKSIRNKHWKKRKRKHAAELLRKEREDYDKADQDADEWRAREIAKDIAKRKVEGMKAIAKLKANEERKRLESELELVLVVEKLQELRSIRIQKLKKQGHFLPEEDDKFLERVRAAVEEEERQTAAAADKDAAKDAIATAEVSRKAIDATSTAANEIDHNKGEAAVNQEQPNKIESERSLGTDTNQELEQQKNEGQGCSGGYDSVANLPPEFYHYYHGSSNDMGTLIEVRRMWDSYIRLGGSRIPGHWVQPPPPSDEVWASYLVGPR